VNGAPILKVCDLKKHFPVRRGLLQLKVAEIKAVDGVSFALGAGETLCLVGESGCGKSTVARLILRLIDPTSGSIAFNGRDITALPREEMRRQRKALQIVFQDPYASLNPRLTAGTIVGEPLENFSPLTRSEREQRVRELLARVGLGGEAAHKYPFEFSGGQRQRLGLARALALAPALIVADEPVSALDVSVQAQTLNLMSDLERDAGVTFLLISHDLAVVAHICFTTAVMFRGRIVEIGLTDELFANPAHPYTRELVDATPRLDRPTRVQPLAPSNGGAEAPEGCPYAARCAFARPRCLEEAPILEAKGDGSRKVACWYPLG